MAGLAVVVPALAELGIADAVEAGQGGDLAEPAPDEDVLEPVGLPRRQRLPVRARVQLVDHLPVALDHRLLRVAHERPVLGERREPQVAAPLRHDVHVVLPVAGAERRRRDRLPGVAAGGGCGERGAGERGCHEEDGLLDVLVHFGGLVWFVCFGYAFLDLLGGRERDVCVCVCVCGLFVQST